MARQTPTGRTATTAPWTPPMRPDGAWFEGTLKSHQREGVAWLLERANAVLADDVGLGKTIEALALIGKLEEAGQLRRRNPRSVCRVLWITDAPLLEQTKSEVKQFLPDFSVATTLDPAFGNSQKARMAWQQRFGAGPDTLVMSYDMARSRIHWLAQAATPSMLVLDEAMEIKGGGKTFDAVHQVAKKAPRVLAMTATPLENHPMELYWLLRAANVPNLWPAHQFKSEFVTWRTVDRGYGRAEEVPVGWRTERLSEVREFLQHCLLQRSAEDVGLPLPTRVGETHRFVQLSLTQQKAYDAASKKFGRAAVVAMEQAAKAAGVESRLVDELMVELGAMGDEQAIVYCEYLWVLDLVEERLNNEGVTYARIEGKIKDADRALAVDAFRSGGARVLLGSRVLERGLNLQHCRRLISLDASWNPARERQREGRIRRIGSVHETFRHLTLLPDTPLTRGKLIQLAGKRASADAISLRTVQASDVPSPPLSPHPAR